MIYDNYQYVDSVLYADSVATAFAGNHTSTTYYNKFWEISKSFTNRLFQKASYKLTCVIYTQWINSGSTTGSTEIENDLRTDLNLFQNFPNPFNPSTIIEFQRADIGFVSLKVYDILGYEVASLVDEYKPAGKYTVEFSSHSGLSGIRELPSGVYFYQLRTDSFVDTKKMILLR